MEQPASGALYGPVDEWDVPLGGLQGQTRVMLGRTYLEAAVAEVRFVAGQRELAEAAAAQVWEQLGTDKFPVFEPSSQVIMTVTITPSGAVPTQESQQGWLLATADRSTAITLLPSLVVVQTRDYQRYSTSLGEPLTKALAAFTAATGVSRVQRLGLRYVNRLTDADASAPGFWRDHIREEFAGPLRGTFATLVAGAHQQVQLRLDETAGARIQSGVFEEQHASAGSRSQYGYLLDLDVFREQASLYEPIRCANQVRQLNRTALALFAHVLSERYLAALNPVPTPPSTPQSDSAGQTSRPITEGESRP